MYTLNLNIKANVNNISLSGIYELLNKYSLQNDKSDNIIEFKGFKFRIDSKLSL